MGPVQVRFRASRPPERIIGLVAAATLLQMLLQAIDAQMEGSWPRFWLWLVGSVAVGAVAGLAETVKLNGGEQA